MPEFAWERLRRAPDVEAPNLLAYDATDRLLSDRALAAGIPGDQIAVIGDEYGAITLSLADAGLTGIRVHQDLVTGRRALARNAAVLGLYENEECTPTDGRVAREHAEATSEVPRFVTCSLDETLLTGAALVLLQLPKALAELEEIADAVARWAHPEVTLVAGGRVKHMTLAQNEVLGKYFGRVQPQRAERKSRLIVATGPLPVAEPPFPVFAEEDGLTLAAYGGAFAGPRLDIGTRALLEVLADREGATEGEVIDLGCGTGALAAWFALQHPDALIIATDRSAAAVRSVRATMAANGLDDRIEVTHDDAGSALSDQSADLILLNPPFHLGTSIHKGAATKLFQASARLLRTGGELLAVWNSHLAYRPQLERLIGPTEQLRRTPKFTVTRSIRRVSKQ